MVAPRPCRYWLLLLEQHLDSGGLPRVNQHVTLFSGVSVCEMPGPYPRIVS